MSKILSKIHRAAGKAAAICSRALSRNKWRRLEKRNVIKLELGSGAKKGKNGWTTVDMSGADINYDLRKGIPLGNNSVDVIYSSHLLEHIPYKMLVPFIQECRRVLKQDGHLSVCVPNARLFVEAYLDGRYFGDPSMGYLPAVVNTGSKIDQLNYIAYMDGQHNYLFDEENLVNTLKKGGFEDVNLRDFDPDIDIPERDHQSIYAVAVKHD